MSTRSRCALALSLVTFALLPVASPARAPDPESLVQEFVRAWNVHDTDALGRLFTQDMEWITVNGTWEKGGARIQAEMKEAHETYFKNTTLKALRTSVRRLQPDVAVIHYVWELTGRIDSQGRTRGPSNGIVTAVLVRQEDGWRIAAAQNTYARRADKPVRSARADERRRRD